MVHLIVRYQELGIFNKEINQKRISPSALRLLKILWENLFNENGKPTDCGAERSQAHQGCIWKK